MKKLLSVLIITFSLSAFAKDNTCSMVIPWPAGGTSDINARALQKGNANITVEYKPGAFAMPAINYMNSNPNVFMLSPLHMYSASNPTKDLGIEFVRVMYTTNLSIVSSNGTTTQDLLTKKVNLVIPALGTVHHAIALELKSKNPLVNVIPAKGDAGALQLLLNKEVDAYISASPILSQWTLQFDYIKNILDLPFGKDVIVGNGLTIRHSLFQGILISKNAPSEFKDHVNSCIDKALKSEEFKKEAEKLNITSPKLSEGQSKEYFNAQLEMLKKYGL